MSLCSKFVDYLIKRARRTPFCHIRAGECTTMNREYANYMERDWLFNAYDDVTHKVRYPLLPSARIHKIKQSDARSFHDHPWWFVTVILRGGYYETRPMWEDGQIIGEITTWHGPGSVLFRRARDFHHITVLDGVPAYTLFITGKWQQVWGFWKGHSKVNHGE